MTRSKTYYRLRIVGLLLGVLAIDVCVAQLRELTWSQVWSNSGVTPAIGDAMVVQWDGPTYDRNSFAFNTLLNLHFDESDLSANTSMDVELRLAIWIQAPLYPDGPDTSLATISAYPGTPDDTIRMSVGHRAHGALNAPVMDALLDRDLDFQGRDLEQFPNGAKVCIRLVAMYVDDGTGWAPETTWPEGLVLESNLRWDFVPVLDNAAPGFSSPLALVCTVEVAAAQELRMSWSDIAGAYEYHLEWTWSDDQDTDVGTYLSAGEVLFDIEHDATRVSVPFYQTQYRIPLTFDRGYLVFRVRAVGRDPVMPLLPVYGPWSAIPAPDPLDPLPNVADVAANAKYPVATAHRKDINWQITSTYAEEGKRKEVMTYADGTLRSRQAVTRNNTLNIPIIGETFYDGVGRPAVETMPVPLVRPKGCDDGNDWAPIELYTNFNLADGGGGSGVDYTYEHMDVDASGDDCNDQATGMHEDNGAELYYHPDHMSVSGALTGAPPFLPQSNHFPFTQTQFTRDNTGRVRSKSGVGEAFKLSGTHATEMFYGKPEQIKLDRLFGSEAGYASHYQKNLTIDPNGQASVAYIDRAGHTVATALAGIPPVEIELEALDSYTAATILQTDLFCGQPSTACDLNEQQPLVPALVYTEQFVVAVEGEYSFEYGLEAPLVEDPCLEVCLHCSYELTMALMDQCGVIYDLEPDPEEHFGNWYNVGSEQYVFACEPPTDLLIDTDNDDLMTDPLLLSPGEYTLTKILRVRTEVFDEYWNELLADSTMLDTACFTPLQTMIDEALAEVDTMSCYIDCNECGIALGSLDDFLLRGEGTEDDYNDLLAACDDLCGFDSWCEVGYRTMLADLSLGGQYAQFTFDALGNAFATDTTSIFYYVNSSDHSTLMVRHWRWVWDDWTDTGWWDDNAGFLGVTTEPAWKQPWLLNAVGTLVSEYRNAEGDLSRLKVDLIGVDYFPEVDDPAHVYTDAGGELYTYPQYLENLADFIVAWQPGWERSLVYYHPEYNYWIECQQFGREIDPLVDLYTTDDYDSLLRASTFERAIEIGILKECTAVVVPNERVLFFDIPGETYTPEALDPLASMTQCMDPYAVHADGTTWDVNTLRDRFFEYKSLDGGLTWYSMPEFAAITVLCGPYPYTMPVGSCLEFGCGTADQNEAMWQTLVGFWLSEKYKAQKQQMDRRLKTIDTPGINYCIGEPDASLWDHRIHHVPLYEPPDDWMNSFAWHVVTAHQRCQVCSESTRTLFREKARRFPEPLLFPGMNMSAAELAYQVYQATGDCPMATAFQSLIQDLAVDDALDATTDISDNNGWVGILAQQANGGPIPPIDPDDEWTITTVTTYTIDASMPPTTGASSTCDVDIDIDGTPSGFSWDAIEAIPSIEVTGATSFSMQIFWRDGLGVLQNATAAVSITSCGSLDLETCNFPQVGTANGTANAWQELLNLISFEPATTPAAVNAWLGSTSDLALEDMELVPSPPVAVPVTVEDQIPQFFLDEFSGTGNTDLQWKWDGTAETWILADGATTNYPQCRLKLVSITTSTGFTTADLNDVYSFRDMRPVGFNLADIDAYSDDPNDEMDFAPEADLLATLRLQLEWWEDNTTMVEVSLGDYGYPESVMCEGYVYDPLPELYLVVKEFIQDAHVPDCSGYEGWDIFSASTMTDDLRELLAPVLCESYDPGPPPVPCPAPSFEYTTEQIEFGQTDPPNHLCPRIYLPHASCIEVADLGPMTVSGAPDANGYYHEFTAIALDVNGDPVMNGADPVVVRVVAECLDPVPCNPCPLDELEEEMLAMFVVDGEEMEDTVDHLHSRIATYYEYREAVAQHNDSLGVLPGSAGHVPLMGYKAFADAGFDQVAPQFVRFLDGYLGGTDNTLINDLGEFTLMYGTRTNVLAEYDRYVSATASYNQRADALQLGELFIVHPDTFSFLLVADTIHAYLQHLANHPIGGQPAMDLQSWISLTMGESPIDLCANLYRDVYLPAHAAYLTMNQGPDPPCPHAAILNPRLSLNAFEETHLCHEPGGQAIFDAYIAALLDTSDCPRGMPSLVNCSVCEALNDTLAPAMDLFVGRESEEEEESEEGCVERYELYLETIDEFNTSDWSVNTGDTIENHYPTYAMFERAGLCDCIDEYIEHLRDYIDCVWPCLISPPVLNIDLWEGCIDPLEVNAPCFFAYEDFVAALDGIAELMMLDEDLEDYITQLNYSSSTLFELNAYCYCVEGFIAQLQYVISDGIITYAEGHTSSIWRIAHYCTGPPEPCDPLIPLPPLEIQLPEEPDPCVTELYAIATNNAVEAYWQQMEDLQLSLSGAYITQCMQAVETFVMRFPDPEHHFTLYYYDQAGNLVRTVPPEGTESLDIGEVDLMTQVVTGQATIDAISSDRANGTKTVFTEHRMSSDYAFNSLNNPIRQAMPDQDNMDIWETALPDGLPTDLIVTGSQFLDGGLGFLSGYQNAGAGGTRGYIFKTRDGGVTWERCFNIMAARINKVHFASNSIGYAVGEYGTILKTTNGGSTWDMLTRLSGLGDELLDVYFHTTDRGVVVGRDAQCRYTVNGGTSFVGYTSILAGGGYTVTGVTYDATHGYVISGVTADGENGFTAQTAQSATAGGLSWTALEYAQHTGEVLCLDTYSSHSAYIGGTAGTLLKTTDDGVTWKARPSATLDPMIDVYFRNDQEGVAIFDSIVGAAHTGVLRWTNDFGATWLPVGKPSYDLTDLYAYEESTQSSLVAVGKDGRVIRIILGSGAPAAPIEMGFVPGAPVDLLVCWAHKSVNGMLRFLTTDDEGDVYWTHDLADPYLQWGGTSGLGVDVFGANYVTDMAVRVQETPGSYYWRVVFLSNTGNQRHGELNGNTDTWTLPAAFGVTNCVAVDHRVASGHAVVLLSTGALSTSGYDITSAIGGSSFTSVTYANTGTYSSIAAPVMFSFNAAGDKIIVGSRASSLAYLSAASMTSNSAGWANKSGVIKPLPLYDLADGLSTSANPTASGGQGQLYQRVSSVGRIIPTGRLDDVTAIAPIKIDGTEFLLGGANSTLHKLLTTLLSAPATVVLPITTDIHDILVQPATSGIPVTVHVAGQDGVILHRQDITSSGSWDVLNYNAGDVLGLAARPGTGSAVALPSFVPQEVVAVGERAMVQRLLATMRVPVMDVFPIRLNDVHFADADNGYAVGHSMVARHTSNGGADWTLVAPHTTGSKHFNAVFSHAPGQAIAVGSLDFAATFNNAVSTSFTVSGSSLSESFSDVVRSANGAIVIASDNSGSGRIYRRNPDASWESTLNIAGDPMYSVWQWPEWNGREDFLVGGENGRQRLLTRAAGNTWTFATPSGLPSGFDIRTIFFHDRINGYLAGSQGRVYKTGPIADLDHTSGWLASKWSQISNATADGLLNQTTTTNITINTIGFATMDQGFMGGIYSGTPAGYARVIFDESDRYSARFWYDKLGRVVLSQNTKQNDWDLDPGTAYPQRFSYTFYDALGRIAEAGEVHDDGDDITINGGTITVGTLSAALGTNVAGEWQPFTIDPLNLRIWVDGKTRYEVVQTHYDEAVSSDVEEEFTLDLQDNLRLRVATTTYQDAFDLLGGTGSIDGDPLTFEHASHYSYDIHGNVKELVQDHPLLGLDQDNTEDTMRYKLLQYSYDLISGNVLQVDYQQREADQFHHRYSYDADNRIDNVETSRNGLTWREDARYFYYPHGPLARVELGQNKVQGMDYAYTLQGWLKGINSDLLTPTNDMGQDALIGEVNELVGRDVYGTSLGYYGDADYEAIDEAGRWLNTSGERPFAPIGTSTGTMFAEQKPLFNGNIASTVNTLAPFGGYLDAATAPGEVLAMVYTFDQLNRLKKARGVVGIGTANLWESVTDAVANRYRSEYTYDPNGNILSTKRWDNDSTPEQYDDMSYGYHDVLLGGSDRRVRNRLYHVTEAGDDSYVDLVADGVGDYPEEAGALQDHYGANTGATNINGSSSGNNYRYDALGNLISDENEEIDEISWTVTGKVRAVDRNVGATAKKDLLFSYGAGGSRIIKEVQDNVGTMETREHYVRDVQGNIMATYLFHDGSGSMKVTSRPVYGSSRVGVDAFEAELGGSPTYDPLIDPIGKLSYELADHLGNVTTVMTDELVGVDPDTDLDYDYFQPVVVSAQGYESFGSMLPERNYGSDSYRFGFQGQEKDDEMRGATGTSYAFEYRLHDPRLGRFLSIDPLASRYPWNSSYAFAENSVVRFVDLEGLERGQHPTLVGESSVTLAVDTDAEAQGRLEYEFNARQNAPKEPRKQVQFIQPQSTIGQGGALATDSYKRGKWNTDHIVIPVAEFALPIEAGKKLVKGEKWETSDYIDVVSTVPVLKWMKAAKGGAIMAKFGDDAFDVAERLNKFNPCGCFDSLTMVLTDNGHQIIRSISVGDSVLAFNDSTRSHRMMPVSSVFNVVRDTLYTVWLDGLALRVSSDHPFYTSHSWRNVRDLRIGDLLITSKGTSISVDSIAIERGIFTFYNITVAGFHTYYASPASILVHNGGPCKFKRASEIKLVHSVETITKSVDYNAIKKLSDKELIESVIKPVEGDFIRLNSRGVALDGNTRLYELQRRGIDVNVPYLEH